VAHIYNKSQHPVEVKRISIRIWSLRDEIEGAIYRRIQECETAGIPLYVDDIKEFYGLKTDRPLTEQPQLKLVDKNADVEASVDALMDSITAEKAAPSLDDDSLDPPEATPPESASALTAPDGTTPVVDGEALSPDSIQAADKIIAEQKTGPVKSEDIQRPMFQRQAPDSDKISYGFALLSDVNMDWMLTFSKNSFVRGQSVVIEFLIPRPFMMNAEVLSCNHYAMRSRVISQTKPDFRLQCRFTYLLSGERGRLRDFLTSVEPSLPAARRPAPKKEDDAGPLS